jgi:MoxR-like ATPase
LAKKIGQRTKQESPTPEAGEPTSEAQTEEASDFTNQMLERARKRLQDMLTSEPRQEKGYGKGTGERIGEEEELEPVTQADIDFYREFIQSIKPMVQEASRDIEHLLKKIERTGPLYTRSGRIDRRSLPLAPAGKLRFTKPLVPEGVKGRVCLVIDVSGSMGSMRPGSDLWNAAQGAALFMEAASTRRLRDNFDIMVIIYADTHMIVRHFKDRLLERDKAKVVREIQLRRVGSSTTDYPAYETAFAEIEKDRRINQNSEVFTMIFGITDSAIDESEGKRLQKLFKEKTRSDQDHNLKVKVLGYGNYGSRNVKRIYGNYGIAVPEVNNIPDILNKTTLEGFRERAGEGQHRPRRFFTGIGATLLVIGLIISGLNIVLGGGADNKDYWSLLSLGLPFLFATVKQTSQLPYHYETRNTKKIIRNPNGVYVESEELEERDFLVIDGYALKCGKGGARTPSFRHLKDNLILITMGNPKNPEEQISFKAKLTPQVLEYLKSMIVWLSSPNPSNNNIALIGPAGVGKNLLCYVLAALTRKNIYQMSFHADMTEDDLIFRTTFGQEGKLETGKQISEILEAADDPDGGIAIADEYNKPRNIQVLSSLNTGLQSRVFRVAKDWIIFAHPDFRFIALANPSPEMEGGGAYIAEELTADVWGRLIQLFIDYLPAEEEAELLREVAPNLLTNLKKLDPKFKMDLYLSLAYLARDLREARKQGKLPLDFTYRCLKRIVRHLEMFPEDIAYFMDVFNTAYNVAYLAPDAYNEVKTLIATKLGQAFTYSMAEDKDLILPKWRITKNNEFAIGDIKIKRGNNSYKGPKPKKVDASPTNIRYKLKLLKDVLLGENILIYGPTGVAKTTIIGDFLINDLGLDPEVQQVTFHTDSFDLLAEMTFKEMRVQWELQPVVEAMDRGVPAFVDEMDKPKNQGVFSGINNILEYGWVSLPDGIHYRNAGFFFIGAANPPSVVRPEYGGSELSGEVFDRVSTHYFYYLSPQEEQERMRFEYPEIDKVVKKLKVSDLLTRITEAIGRLRDTNEQEGVPSQPPARTLERIVELLVRYPQEADSLIERFFESYAGLTERDKAKV